MFNFLKKNDQEKEKPADTLDIMSVVSFLMNQGTKLMIAADKSKALFNMVSDFITPERLQTVKQKLHELASSMENDYNKRVVCRMQMAENQSDVCIIISNISTTEFEADGLPKVDEKVFYLSQVTHDQIMSLLQKLFFNGGTTAEPGK